MPEALASRDIATVYRLLTRHGVPQRQIAAATGQSQSEVCEIRKGRQVQAYDVLVRICEGLRVPREAMGLGCGAYPVDSPAPQPGGEDEADVLRRQFAHLLALAGAAAVGAPIPGVGELLADPRMPGLISDVPSRVGRADVEVVRNLTRAVADAARTVGGQAGAADQSPRPFTQLRTVVARPAGPPTATAGGPVVVDRRVCCRDPEVHHSSSKLVLVWRND